MHLQRLLEAYPDSPHQPEALHLCALCAEKLHRQRTLIQSYQKRLFEGYPSSPYAAAAYFHYYSYREYLQGDKDAIAHLKAFRSKFPGVPEQIIASYLIGLDCQRERRRLEKGSLHKRNLSKAIKAFFNAESYFDELYYQGKVPEEQLSFYVALRYRAALERALSNQAVAAESHSTKRAIYGAYAKALLLQINGELADQAHPFACYLTRGKSFSSLQQESLYALADCYLANKDLKAASQTIAMALSKFASAGTNVGYYLSLCHSLQASIAMQQGAFEGALMALKLAEEANQKGCLNVDQKLALWILQSKCYLALNQTDRAMLTLSKVINDNTISSLRVKAMYLRAKIYTTQGRHELARRQLSATAQKGGKWALKAKLKLEEEYGF
jgi:tetratricopeptide (TPR) repeat protein